MPHDRPCQRPDCTRPAAVVGERYCWHHREEEIRRLARAGYLQPLARTRRVPASERAAAARATDDSGSVDDMVRILEG